VKWQIPARTLVVLLTLLPIAAYANNTVAARKETAGDFARGMHLYQACMGCHSLDENDVGPRHRGVVGRRAGTVAGYAYSGALCASGLTWTRAISTAGWPDRKLSCRGPKCITPCPGRRIGPISLPIWPARNSTGPKGLPMFSRRSIPRFRIPQRPDAAFDSPQPDQAARFRAAIVPHLDAAYTYALSYPRYRGGRISCRKPLPVP
jgi:hypothetical protein